uniref:Cytochrome b-c1 complex subunit 2, mitochondrial n=1 Tax=Lygus hesperus TaxID=30085 RepID=A0A0A9W4D8_LYGHE
MGLFVKNGPRYEDSQCIGSSAVMESLPLLGNAQQSGESISKTLGTLSNAFKVDNKREAMSFVLMAPSYHRKEALSLLNGMCLHPTQDAEIFERAKQDAMKRASIVCRDATNACFELLHDAG